jgi:hypothetical protein
VFLVRNELGFNIPENDMLHSHRRDYLKSYRLCLSGLHRA